LLTCSLKVTDYHVTCIICNVTTDMTHLISKVLLQIHVRIHFGSSTEMKQYRHLGTKSWEFHSCDSMDFNFKMWDLL